MDIASEINPFVDASSFIFSMCQTGAIIRAPEIPSAIFFTELFNRTKCSLLSVLILHETRNTTQARMA